MKTKVLVVEDEDKIARLLEMELNYEGYEVVRASTGKAGLEKARVGGWGIILLDIMLPELSGTEVLRLLRMTDEVTPVIMLTARNATLDKVSGLDQGANDYMTKPFEIEELLARIRSFLRTRKREDTAADTFKEIPELKIADVTINTKAREVSRGHTTLELTTKEFDLLVYLTENRNHVLSRQQILNRVWGYDFIGDSNVVDVYIRYLRKKIDHPFQVKLIQTYRGVGYCLKEAPK